MTRVKLLGFKIAPNTLSFGMVLNENRSDCQAGVEVQTMNGLYLISERRWDEKVGELHLSFERVRSNRRSRRQKIISGKEEIGAFISSRDGLDRGLGD